MLENENLPATWNERKALTRLEVDHMQSMGRITLTLSILAMSLSGYALWAIHNLSPWIFNNTPVSHIRLYYNSGITTCEYKYPSYANLSYKCGYSETTY